MQFVLQTVWKFYNFSIIQILREINFGESRGSEFQCLCIFALFETEINQIVKIQAPKIEKTEVLELLDPPKLISRKILVPHCERRWRREGIRAS